MAAGGTVTYSYDALGRLRQVTYPNGVTVTYALDAAGNRTNVTTTQPPSAPGTPTFSSITGSTATAAWTAPSSGTAPTGYEYTLNGGTSWTSVGTALSANLSGLANDGTQYTFSVRAYDAEGGQGAESTATFSTAPSAPGTVAISNIGETTATASWGAATDASGVSGYEYSLNGGSSWTNARNTLTVNLSGLAGGTQYTLSVRAYDAAGTRGGSSSATFSTAPTAPGTVTISNIAATTATASWGAATDAGGVAGYEYSLNGGSSWTNVGNTLTVNLGGLIGETQYTFSVRAYDGAGNRGPSSSSTFTTAAVVPSTPTGLSATVAGDNQVNISWNASSDSGGPGLAGYKIYRDGTQIGTSSSTSYSDTGVTPFNTYTYTVAAYDTHGTTSGQSAAASASTFYQITNSVGGVIAPAPYLVSVYTRTRGENYWHLWQDYGSGEVVVSLGPSGATGPTLCETAGTLGIASGYQRNGCIVDAEPSVYGH